MNCVSYCALFRLSHAEKFEAKYCTADKLNKRHWATPGGWLCCCHLVGVLKAPFNALVYVQDITSAVLVCLTILV